MTESASRDLEQIPATVEDTFWNKVDDIERNLDLGADPGQTFDKYMEDNMHPTLQMNLGRDYRAWFLEGKYLSQLENGTVYGLKVLPKTEAEHLTGQIPDALTFFRGVLGQYQDP